MTEKDIKGEFLSVKRALFERVYGKLLNPEQMRAVFTTKGPLLVLAGAGSGKTTVLVNRIVYLIKYGDAYFSEDLPRGVDADTVSALKSYLDMTPEEIEGMLDGFATEPAPPWAILAFTFTNKAAGEIKDRLLKKFGDRDMANSIWAGTFHSICLRILRKYADRLGYREGFSVYDADDSKRMIANCMKELEIDEKRLAPKAAANLISRAKDMLVVPEEYEVTFDPRSREVKEIYKLYQKKMLEYNAVDFDDIIMQTVRLLEEYPDVREYYQRKFKYVLVDEYQDTNHAQFVLTKLLSGGYRNIMVVGDDDQSIYRFRGATIENILDFDKTYPDATVVKLEQNYRSTSNILGAANAIIKNNDERHDKELWCERGEGEKITLKELYDQNAEGKFITDEIVSAVYKQKRTYSDFAVLYRLNALGRTLQTAFAKSGIPFRVVGDLGFYERKEIKDMMAYLSVCSFTGDNLRLKRIINEPKRKIGMTTVEAVEELASMNGLSMFDLMARACEYPALAKSAQKLGEFVALINGIREEHTLPSAMLEAILDRSGYRAMLEAEGFEGEGKLENIGELISAAVEYERKIGELGEEPTLLGFLEEVALITSVDKYDEDADAVVLMTVHAAKGLEFPVVFLAGMEDGIFPSQSDRADKSEMNEERRLAYVAITRAKDKLYITYARSRMMYGRTQWGMLSSFIREEVPDKFLLRDEPPKRAEARTFGSAQGFGGGRGFGTAGGNASLGGDGYGGSFGGRGYDRGGYDKGGWNTSRDTGDGFGERGSHVGATSEMRRSVNSPRTSTPSRGAAQFGVTKLPVGSRVSHAAFGEGEIIFVKDVGGDVLYEVRFDNGVTKKLMATYAKLKKV